MYIMTPNLDFSAGSIPIQWCLSKTEQTDVLKKTADEYAIFFVVEQNEVERQRMLLPLDQAVQFVAFYDSGVQTLHAFLVTTSEGQSMSKLKERLLERDRWGDYEFVPVRYGSVIGESRWPCQLVSHDAIEFDVPDEFFAPEPNKWLTWWATLTWQQPLRDQCDLKKRLLYAFSLQLLFVLIIWVVRGIIALVIGGIAGLRGTNWRAVIFFNELSTKDIWDDTKSRWPTNSFGRSGYDYRYSCFWIENSNGEIRPTFLLLFNPITLALIVIAALLFKGETLFVWILLKIMLYLFLSMLAIRYLIGPAIVSIIANISWIGNPLSRFWHWAWTGIQHYFEQKELEARQETVAVLACTPDDKLPTLSTLTRRRLSLRFQSTKAKVCHPYPRKRHS